MTKKEQSWDNTLIAVHYPMAWIAYAKEKDLPIQQILHRCGIIDRKLSALGGIRIKKFAQLMTEILLLGGNQAIGFEIGWRLPITAYGSLGQAMLSSATARDAMTVCMDYWRLIARGFSLNISLHNDQCVLTLMLDMPVPEPFRHIVFESTLVSLYRGCLALVPMVATSIEVWLSEPEPTYSVMIREKIPSIRFDMPVTQIRFPASILDQPLAMASATGLQTALERCEEELRILNLQDKISQKVLAKLIFNGEGYPSLIDMAQQLNVAPRTLRRRLSDENTGYARLIEKSRQRDAMQLLDNSQITIAEVARRLGYTDIANFTRAFKRWTGITPSGYREKLNS